MLSHLVIRNIVLIEELSLDFTDGLTVLTGETGAGKSILLDALGLALGARANFDLIRAGADRAHVAARFDIEDDHPIWGVLADAGLEPASELIVKRQLRRDGKSPATINDEPVSVALLRQCGDMLIEIQGQFEGRGLLDPANHLGLLDRACHHEAALRTLRKAGRTGRPPDAFTPRPAPICRPLGKKKNFCVMRSPNLISWPAGG